MWDKNQKEAWLLLTDLVPADVSPTWYGLRMWIEEGFKALKSGGFHWERTRMTDPARAERLWLVLALATLRCAASADLTPEPAPLHAPPLPLRRPTPPSSKPTYRSLSIIKRGLFSRLAASILGQLPGPLSLRAQAFPPAPLLALFDP